jgi:nucleotide-binding universal stress UspA family protein
MAASIQIIVVGFDYSPAGFRALENGIRMASRVRSAEPHVLLVAREAGDEVRIDALGLVLSPVSAALMLREDVEAETRKAAIRGEARGLSRVVTHVRAGDPADELVLLAASLGAGAIVLGEARKTLPPAGVRGRVTERVRRAARCPVYAGTNVSGEVPMAGAFHDWERTRRIVA